MPERREEDDFTNTVEGAEAFERWRAEHAREDSEDYSAPTRAEAEADEAADRARHKDGEEQDE